MVSRLATLLLIFSFLVSCSEDTPPSATDLTGNYKLISWEISEPLDLHGDGENTVFWPGCLGNSTLVLNANGEGSIFFNSVMHYSLMQENGNKSYGISCSSAGDWAPSPIEYTMNGNQISAKLLTDYNTAKSYLSEDLFTMEAIGNKIALTIPSGFVVQNAQTWEVEIVQDLTFVYLKQ